jgi:iron complex outermembrane receptor protein
VKRQGNTRSHHARAMRPTARPVRKHQNLKSALVLGTGTTLFGFVVSAQAQSQNPTIDEVVVSATRRDTAIQDIPYSISAISASSLEDNHVQSLSDLTRMIAGVSFVDSGPASRSNIVLRGINANATNQQGNTGPLSTVSPVSTYIGETPLFLSLQIDDIERVEVLRGPQGTLYGSGSLAGTLRFIPKKPDLTGFHAEVEGDVAGVDQTNELNRSVSGMVNIPLSSATAFRVSAGYQHYAGFIDENYIVKLGPASTAVNSPVGVPVPADPNNPTFSGLVFDPEKNANDANLWHVRASFLFQPSDKFSALLAYYHQVDDSNGVQAQSPNFGGSVDTLPADNPYYSAQYPVSFPTGGTIFPHNQKYEANDSFLLEQRRHADLASADLTYSMGFASLTSSTSYYKDVGHNVVDGTGLLTLYPDFYGFLPRMVDYETTADEEKGFVQELRLVSTSGGKLDYVVGLFYQKIDSTTGEMQWVPGQTYFGGLTGYAGANADTLGDVNVIGSTRTQFKDRAAFGELTLHITDAWQVTGGLRKFKQDFSLADSTAFPFCGLGCSNIEDQLGTTLTQKGYSVSDHISKLNTSYKFSNRLNTYFNYAEGFRRGGANGLPVSGPFAGNPALLVYKPDKTKNYEIGVKGTLAGVRYSAALFYIDWNNFQVDATSIAAASRIAVNGDKARSKGVELELDGEIIRHLTYQLGYSYARAEVARDFTVYDLNTSGELVGLVTSKAGDPLPNAPRNSATAALDYTHPAPLMQGWNMRWHLDASYRSATLSQLLSTDPGNPPPFKIPGFSIWDASLNLASSGGLYTSLYVQNLFNALGETGGTDRGAVGIRAEQFFIGRPRTVGLKVGYSF